MIDTTGSENPNFASLLSRAASLYTGRTAIAHRSSRTSFSALGRRAAGIAAALTNMGIGDADRVAVLARSPEDSAAGFFAALGVGATGINVNELYKPRQIEFVLAHSRAKVLLVGSDVLKSMPRDIETAARVVVMEEIQASSEEFAPKITEADAPAQITYTSGSTG